MNKLFFFFISSRIYINQFSFHKTKFWPFIWKDRGCAEFWNLGCRHIWFFYEIFQDTFPGYILTKVVSNNLFYYYKETVYNNKWWFQTRLERIVKVDSRVKLVRGKAIISLVFMSHLPPADSKCPADECSCQLLWKRFERMAFSIQGWLKGGKRLGSQDLVQLYCATLSVAIEWER